MNHKERLREFLLDIGLREEAEFIVSKTEIKLDLDGQHYAIFRFTAEGEFLDTDHRSKK